MNNIKIIKLNLFRKWQKEKKNWSVAAWGVCGQVKEVGVNYPKKKKKKRLGFLRNEGIFVSSKHMSLCLI